MMPSSQCGTDSADPLAKTPLGFEFPPPGTRHHTLLNSNEVPLDAELDMVKSVVLKADVDLAGLDDMISKTNAGLGDEMRQLVEQRASLSSYRARHQAILSPLRRAPPEILGEIFFWTLPSPTPRQWRDHDFTTTKSPWILTHVSCYWRAVAISSPALWSLLPISFITYNTPSYPLDMIETHLARSHKLKIHFYGNEETESLPQVQIFQCLARHAFRWEELSLRMTSALVPLLADVRDRLLALRRLSLEWDVPDSETVVDSIDSFQSVPSLVDATVYNMDRYVSIPFPCNQLTRYQLDAPWRVHADLLSVSPNLVQAGVTVSFDEEPWPPVGETIQLRRLRQLYLSHSSILEYLALPVLDELTIEVVEGPHGLQPLARSIKRSSSPLRNLYFIGCPDAPSICILLQELPSITALGFIIDDSCTEEQVRDVIENFTVSESAVVASQLRSLSFGVHTDELYFSFNYSAYVLMVKSRWESRSCALTSTTLLAGGEESIDATTLDGLNALRAEGLDMTLLHGKDATEAIYLWTFEPTWT
ncbi:hypothetical protein B0H16DRAFT_1830828 [Mycena metata]|uniref:F-box domain-containing protein n=1 Tax=Mycena metata TaxID=1033252 RepID=A0AAD7J1S3_9AGAR|nr:hypothetical protein B0H16DRAFT_1830828 [Mycena metata]